MQDLRSSYLVPPPTHRQLKDTYLATKHPLAILTMADNTFDEHSNTNVIKDDAALAAVFDTLPELGES